MTIRHAETDMRAYEPAASKVIAVLLCMPAVKV
jgi:hypothetical protein